MVEPTMEQLEQHVESKFALITIVSKRARQLNAGYPGLVESQGTGKPVTLALEEIAAGKIKYKHLPIKEKPQF